MPDLRVGEPAGVLRARWSAGVDDYAIAGGWTRGGKALVVGDASGGIHTFDSKSGALAWAQRSVHEDGLLALAMHPKNPIFATAGQDGRVLIWDADEGRIQHSLEIGKDWVDNLAWSPDGAKLAVSCSRMVHVYGADGKDLWRSDKHPSTVSALAWPSAEELATACYGQVTFLNAATGELNQKLAWKGSLVSMALSPDGGIVACGSQDNSVHFWRRSTEQDSMMAGYPGKPSALAFDDSGILLATGGSPVVTVWSFHGDGPEGSEPGVLELHQLPITDLAFADRGKRLASGSRDGSVAVWKLKRNGDGAAVGAALLVDAVSKLYWRPDGNGLAGLDAQGGVTVWRVN